jgi:hypothetical protein
MMETVESAYGLVGRDAVLREIATSVEDLSGGRGRLVLVAGEPGMGKSAVLQVAGELAARRGLAVLTARCSPEAGTPPLWCWTQLLRSLRSQRSELDPWLVTRLLDPVAGAAASRTQTSPPSSQIGPDLSFRLHEAIAAALVERAAAGPILLAIDDLQWADGESVAVLAFLARQLATDAVLLLGTYRDAEAGPGLRAVAARAELLTLLGLDGDGVGALIGQIQGTRPDLTLAAAVRDRSGGNPLFVRELTRLAMARGGWSAEAGPGAAPVPDSIAATLRERLARLSAGARRLLEAAALIGRQSSADLLARVLAESRDRVMIAADEAVLARVLHPTGDRAPDPRNHRTGWAFVHDLYREMLAADLEPTRRTRLHGAIAEALEQVGDGGAERVSAGRLSAHFLASGESGRAKAGGYARLAATEATQRFGHREAVGYLELALRVGEHQDPVGRLGLVLDLGAARHRAGDRAGAAACFRQVAADTDDPLLLSRAALGLAALEVRSGTPIDDNVSSLRRAIAAVEHGDPGPAGDGWGSRLYAALARELVHADLAGTGSPVVETVRAVDEGADQTADQAADRWAAQTAARAADRAIELAERAGDLQARASALLARHDTLWRRGTAKARLPLIGDLISTAAIADDPQLVAEGLQLRSAALLELGDPEGVAELRRFVESAERLGHARGHWAALSRRATVAGLTGDLHRAAALATEAWEFGEEIGVPDARGCFGTTMISLIVQGLPATVEPPPEDDPVAAMIPVLVAISEPEIDHQAEVRSVLVSALTKTYDLESLVAAASAFARWGSEEQLRAIEAELRTYAGLHVVVGGCAAYYGPVDYYLGIVAAALGDDSRARAHLEAAAGLARQLGARGWADLAADHLRGSQRREERAAWIREGATWRLAFAQAEVHLPDSKGLRDIAALLASPGHDVHVYTLLGRNEPVLGADPVLDDEAKRRYRRRIEALRSDIEAADDAGDEAASQLATVELEAVLHELSTATGLGGRHRRLGDEVERARKTVSARIHDTLQRVKRVHPELGAHLAAAITVGVRCAYRPAEPVNWELGSR